MFDSDDDDFSLSPSSQLSSIFNKSQGSDKSGASLSYKAPKQPKPAEESNGSTNSLHKVEKKGETQSNVLVAKVVSLWKLENGKNTLLGKYMVALIGNFSNTLSEIILYQDKSNILLRETVGKALTFYKYPNNFLAFHDSQKQLWNLHFDTSENLEALILHATQHNCTVEDRTDQTQVADTKAPLKDEELIKHQNNKEAILSRVTKFGQPILPQSKSELSESETESSCSEPVKPVITPRKFKRNTHNLENRAITPLDNNHIASTTTHYLVPNNNQMMLNAHNSPLMYAHQPLPDYSLSNFIFNQNAELKANLAEINMKLNNVLNSRDSNGNKEDVGALNTKIKCQNLKVDNLTTELEKVKRDLNTLRGLYQDKCEELQETHLKNVHAEKAQVELSIFKEKIELMERELEGYRNKLEMKEKELEVQSNHMKELESQVTEGDALKLENIDLSQKLENLTLQLKAIQDKETVTESQEGIVDIERDRKITKVVKESMNEAFTRIMESFADNESYSVNEIQTVLLDNLKKTSYKLMNSLL